MSEELGTRMKEYEDKSRFMPGLPVVVRLDGRCFSVFTKGLRRPYDERLSKMMVEVTRALVHESHALVGYTQSDEITLILRSDMNTYFGARVQKIVSILAAFASVEFNRMLPERIPEKASLKPIFDARAFSVPSLLEASNALLWREYDARKNSCFSAARAHLPHAELLCKSSSTMESMLLQKGIVYEDYPDFFKSGTYVRRIVVKRKLDAQELELLPLKHNARKNPDMLVERNEIVAECLPPLGSLQNRLSVLFRGARPIVGEFAGCSVGLGQKLREARAEVERAVACVEAAEPVPGNEHRADDYHKASERLQAAEAVFSELLFAAEEVL